MGLAHDLSYAIGPSNAGQRLVRVVASSRPGAWALARVLPTLDRAVARRTRGRTTLVEQLAGLPVLVVTTTGRRSGLPRPAQLIAIPVGDDLALIGTNFGQTRTPPSPTAASPSGSSPARRPTTSAARSSRPPVGCTWATRSTSSASPTGPCGCSS